MIETLDLCDLVSHERTAINENWGPHYLHPSVPTELNYFTFHRIEWWAAVIRC